MKNVLRSGKIGVRSVDKQAFAIMIVTVCLVSVNRQKREQADQLQALTEHIGQRNIICPVIIGIQGQHASGKRIHHIAAWSFHNNVPYKACRESAVVRKQGPEVCKLLFVRQFVKKQKICNLFKAKTVIRCKTINQILHVVSTVKKLTMSRMRHPVNDFGCTDI